ncbi:Uncharacterised protein [Yersinia frederiksenii]|nr:Uncharacterised protein [Yersinia frederiksenii]
MGEQVSNKKHNTSIKEENKTVSLWGYDLFPILS